MGNRRRHFDAFRHGLGLEDSLDHLDDLVRVEDADCELKLLLPHLVNIEHVVHKRKRQSQLTCHETAEFASLADEHL